MVQFITSTITRNLARILVSGALLCTVIGTGFAATPRTQQAIVQVAYGGPEVLQAQTIPVLQPGENQVLIRVYAAAMNATDWYMRKDDPFHTTVPVPVVPGGDVAGIIEKLGPGVTAFKVGDRVSAVISRSGNGGTRLNGGYSHFVVAELNYVQLKPKAMTFAEAAGLGVASISGIRAVMMTKVGKGDRMLITGISGGVGSAAAQAAKARGVYVIGTASARHNDYLRSLGVDEVIDYTHGKFEAQVHDVDAVLDTVGADTTERSMSTLKKGGRFLSVARGGTELMCAAAGVVCIPRGQAYGTDRSVIDEVSSLAESGKLKIKVDKTFPLSQAAEAQQWGEQGHTEGKIVLIVDAAKASTK
jgi:NADPH:quinone reductase-like Zn-dependent oxidoreductase